MNTEKISWLTGSVDIWRYAHRFMGRVFMGAYMGAKHIYQ